MNNPVSISVGIHQPNILPWIGYFIKIAQSNHFIFHDAAEYSKNSITRRTRIRKSPTDLSSRYLIVPLNKHSDFEPICALQISEDPKWIKKNISIISNNYRKTPYYNEVYPVIESYISMAKEYSNFSDYSISIIQMICKLLDISSTFSRSSEMMIKGSRSELNINLIKSVGGNLYNSGQGGKKYQKEVDFLESDIHLNYLDVTGYLEDQNINKVTLGYSIIELLFCEGIESVKNLIDNYESYY